MGDRRSTLRGLMFVIAIVALFLGMNRQGSFGYAWIAASHSIVAWGVCFALSMKLARDIGPALRAEPAWCLLALLVACLCYLAWAQDRALNKSAFGLDHGFPYPDAAINALERWFDARRPVPPESLKLHGEYPMVAFLVGMVVIAFASLTGLLFGLLLNQPRESREKPGPAKNV